MPIQNVRYPDAVIADGDTESQAVDVRGALGILIIAPASVAGAISVQASVDDGETFADLEDEDGTAVALTADTATPVTIQGATHIRVATTVAPTGADEVFQVGGQDPL